MGEAAGSSVSTPSSSPMHPATATISRNGTAQRTLGIVPRSTTRPCRGRRGNRCALFKRGLAGVRRRGSATRGPEAYREQSMGPWEALPRANEIISMLTICSAETTIFASSGSRIPTLRDIEPLNSADRAPYLASMLTIQIAAERVPWPCGISRRAAHSVPGGNARHQPPDGAVSGRRWETAPPAAVPLVAPARSPRCGREDGRPWCGRGCPRRDACSRDGSARSRRRRAGRCRR